LEDTQVSLLFTQQRLVKSLPKHRASVICLDTGWEVIGQESEETPINGGTVDNLAYVIYTSGSTGTPKGVMVPHRGFESLTQEQARIFNVKSDSRVLQFSSLSFDASIFEIVMALLNGATLCLGTQDSLLPGSNLIRLLRDQEIAIVTLPPSALAALPVEKIPTLRTINVAGEVCSAGLVARWAANHRFFNLYGPTETTIWATAAELDDGSRTPHIGRPIGNTQIYILNSQLQPVPVGVPGELYIGGVGVTRGYLNRPELTADRFISNPFSDEPNARLYKTGDLARYLPDGNIEFLGRIDHQVKIRGFRIELGEIEAVLAQHPAAREVVVIVREDNPGDKRLLAYIILNQPKSLDAADLRAFLKQKLPDYMIPTAFITMDAFPLTPNGKIDRRALPAPEQAQISAGKTFVSPRTPVEETLVKIWEEILGLKRIGVQDNFFDLGGHSLLATQVMSRLQGTFQVEIPLRNFFESPTVAELAELIETVRWTVSNDLYSEAFSMDDWEVGEL